MVALEVAEIFRRHGPAWRRKHVGHVLRCEGCERLEISYNACRNRHCPKCQGNAARKWLLARQGELLPLEYYHVVFTLPAALGDIAYQNPAVVYDLLFKAGAETLQTIAADPKHLGARIGFVAVLHTWGSAMTHHPHLHCIVPGGGLLPEGTRWIACKRGFFLPVRVLSRRFRRLFLERLSAAHRAGRLAFFGPHRALTEASAFAQYLAPIRDIEWVVYAKRPFSGPKAVLAYLSRYTHRIAISNRRLIAHDERGVTFRWKDYRAKSTRRHKTLCLTPGEFIRRFLIHVLPSGFHRLRHHGLLANGVRTENLAKARALLGVPPPVDTETAESDATASTFSCPKCGHAMRIIETFERGYQPPAPLHRGGDPP